MPVTIGWFWLRYLPIHDWFGTTIHVVAVVLAVMLGVAFYWRARETLRGWAHQKFEWIGFWKIDAVRIHAEFGLFVALLTLGISDGAINGVRKDYFGYEDAWAHRQIVPQALHRVNFRAELGIRNADVSVKPADWTGLGTKPGDLTAADLAQVVEAQLAAKDLRYAAARGAFLVKADLARADLQGADLEGANLYDANLHRANLREADLEGADLDRTNLQVADLAGANLQGAKFFIANLRGANFSSADLQRADRRHADLQWANFLGANLRGADLSSADLRRADLQGAYLWDADLQRADFQQTDLQGASLTEADLQGAVLIETDFQGAVLIRANLQGAVLWRVDFHGANLFDAKYLPQAQLDKACGDENTKLSDGLTIKLCPEWVGEDR